MHYVLYGRGSGERVREEGGERVMQVCENGQFRYGRVLVVRLPGIPDDRQPKPGS